MTLQSEKLSRKKEKLVADLFTEETDQKAAKTTGLAEIAAYHRPNLSEFQQDYGRAKSVAAHEQPYSVPTRLLAARSEFSARECLTRCCYTRRPVSMSESSHLAAAPPLN